MVELELTTRAGVDRELCRASVSAIESKLSEGYFCRVNMAVSMNQVRMKVRSLCLQE
jgi:hypothetical protein